MVRIITDVRNGYFFTIFNAACLRVSNVPKLEEGKDAATLFRGDALLSVLPTLLLALIFLASKSFLRGMLVFS
jgi:hypothetical protein